MQTVSQTSVADSARLKRLLGFLEYDPTNLALLADAANAAYDDHDLPAASTLLERHAAECALPSHLVNLRGLIALAEERHSDAAHDFEIVMTSDPSDLAVRFNLAWSRAMLADHAGALDLLDDPLVDTIPPARALKVRMLHHLARLEDALACGKALAELYPDDVTLMGVLSAVALDADDTTLAGHYAGRAGSDPAGLATRGALLLADHQLDAALDAFGRVIASQPTSGRGWVGQGLGFLSKGDIAAATYSIDRGAALFGDHLGSWIASGWSNFLQGDYATSRARFQTALSLDDGFAEAHGGLAVLDMIDGDYQTARRRTDIAYRLDRRCFSAALARSMILAGQGDAGGAQRIRDVALHQRIGESGQTIAQAMVRLGLAATPPGCR